MVGTLVVVGFVGFVNSASSATCLNCGDPELTCSPANQTGDIGDVFNFTANGGSGTYSWTATAGNPSVGSGQNFSTTYSVYGNKTVTVKSGTQTATCSVSVECEQGGSCVPPTGLTPRGSIVSPTGQISLGWNPVPGATHYNVRLDDGTSDRYDDPRFTTCSDNSHYYCENNVTVTNIPNVPVTAGRTYEFWVDPQFSPARDYCNGITTFTIVAPPAETHKACVNNACKIVSGPGPNSCNTNSDCAVTPPPPPSCDFPGALTGNITSYSGAQAHATVTNNSACNKVVTFASYEVFIEPGQPGWLDTQVLHDYQTVTLSAGQTQQLTVDNASCRTQIDIYEGQVQPHLSDEAGGFPGQNLLDYEFTSNPLCGATPTLSCSPQNQTVAVNANANFTATGGTGTYSWSTNIGSDSGNPASGTGTNFTTSYSTPGNKTVTVSSGSQTVACNVTVNELPPQTLTCNPQNQSVFVNSSANFTASGGTGTYSWSGGESPSTGSGSSFSTSYSSVGNRTVTVSSGNQTATCNVVVNTEPQQTLSCNPQSQSGNVGSFFNFTATGGSGTYSWIASDGSPVNGTGSNFWTQYNSSGFRTVIVTSGNQTATCNVTVNQQQQNNLTCGPQNQTANVGDLVNFYANGGNGNYSWNAYDAQITSGYNQNFSTRFNTTGSRNVTVTSNGQTATCYVNVNNVAGNNTYFQITKNVLNRTLNQNVYVNFVEAQSNDSLEFEIKVRNTGNTNAEVNLKDILPADLNYVYGSATMNGYYLNDSVINYNGVSLGNIYPGEEKVIRLRATVRPNAPAVTITNQAIATMNSNTQNAFATIQIRNRGQVLGAADIVTGPEDVMPWALSLGFIFSLVVYFYFFYSRPERKNVSFAVVNASIVNSEQENNEDAGVFKAVRPKKELDALLSELKKSENVADI